MEQGKRGRTFGRTALTVVGIAMGMLVFGVALALVTIQLSGSVASNEFLPPTTSSTTTTSTIPQGDGLQAAFVNGPADCVPGIPTGALTLGSGSFDLNNNSAQVPPSPNILCARNAGPGDIASLTVTVTAASTGEDGCSTAEGAVDPEGVTCGADGELDDILLVRLDPEFSEDPNCSLAGQIQVPLDTPVSLLTPGSGDPLGLLQQGNMCTWRVRLFVPNSATDDQKLAASTDTAQLTFDIAGSG